MTSYLLGVAAVLLLVAFIVEMLRRGILREKFAALWLLVAFILLVLVAWPNALIWTAEKFGFVSPVNLVFSLGLVLLAGVAVQLSFEVSKLEERTRRQAEDFALLRMELEELVDRIGRE